MPEILPDFDVFPEGPSGSDRPIWPKPGDRLRLRADGVLWAFHTNIEENGKRLLRADETYTLKSIGVSSSWARVTLEEMGDADFCLGFFEPVEETADWRIRDATVNRMKKQTGGSSPTL